MESWHVYMLRCGDQSIYTGISLDVARRLEEHRSGRPKGAKYLRGRGPLTLIWTHPTESKSEAQSLEIVLKKLPRGIKEKLASGKLKFPDLIEWVAV